MASLAEFVAILETSVSFPFAASSLPRPPSPNRGVLLRRGIPLLAIRRASARGPRTGPPRLTQLDTQLLGLLLTKVSSLSRRRKTRNEERGRRRRVELSEAGLDGSADSPRGASRARRRIRRRRTVTRATDEAAGRRASRERARDRRRLSRAKARRDELPRCQRGVLRGRSGAEPSGLRRLALDSAPSLTWRLASGRKDAQDAQAGGRAPLPRKTPHADRHDTQTKRTRPYSTGSSQTLSHYQNFYLKH